MNSGDKKKMMSLGVGLGTGRNGMKGVIQKVMLEGIYDNELTAGVFRQDDQCWR